jgi:hypothetical protein
VPVSDEPPGTVFQATQDGVVLRSRPWGGRVRATAPPQVQGRLRVGARVRPVAAVWQGGWGRESDWLQLQACRTAAGSGCLVIYDPIKFGRCPGGEGRLLPARYRGRWLRVADARIDRNQPFTQEGYSAPEGVRPLRAAPGIAVATVGRIGRGRAPRQDCGGPGGSPTATLRASLRPSRGGRLVVGRATCPIRCTIRVVVRQGRRTITARLPRPRGEHTVFVPARGARLLRAGRLRMTVFIGGQRVAGRRAVLRRR